MKTQCHHCANNIAYETEMQGQTVACPHCGEHTRLAVKPPPLPVQPKAVPDFFRTVGRWTVLAVCAVVIFTVLMAVFVSTGAGDRMASGMGPAMVSGTEREAYHMAVEAIRQQYPGAKSFSSYKESAVRKEGGRYYVAVIVDGVNSFNAPVRKTMGVELEYQGSGRCQIVAIK